MKNRYLIRATLCSLFFFTLQAAPERYGVAIVPVADLFINPAPLRNKGHAPNHSLSEVPHAPNNPHTDLPACPRLHQLLFNEIVKIVEQYGNELRIAIPNTFHIAHTTGKPQSEYWVDKKAIAPLGGLEQHGIDATAVIPPAIDFKNPKTVVAANCVTLKYAATDPHSNMQFSPGTRFMRTGKAGPTSATISVKIFDNNDKKVRTLRIPRSACITEYSTTTPARIAQFVKLLKEWAHETNSGVIPYVWGGCSLVKRHKPNAFTTGATKINNTPYSYFTRAGEKNNVKTGIDCSGLVIRAAQVCGIPYFCKNSSTLMAKLDPIKKGEQISEGDLIWIPGHVMVVADRTNNTIIEARHYDHGFGKVQEISLAKSFKGIKTYDDLLRHYHQNIPLHRLDKSGAVKYIVSRIKLLKMNSVFRSAKQIAMASNRQPFGHHKPAYQREYYLQA